MDTLLETYSSPKLNQGKKDNLNRLIIASDIEPVIKNNNNNNNNNNLQTKVQGWRASLQNVTKHTKRIC